MQYDTSSYHHLGHMSVAQVRHDSTVTWLAYWHDPVSKSQFKYVWLAANSTWKAEADKQKYEKARDLKNHVDRIRCFLPVIHPAATTILEYCLVRTSFEEPVHR